MPKFLANCHYNEEEISQILKKKNIDRSKLMATRLHRSNSEKAGKSWEGVDFSWLSTKVSRALADG